MDDRKKTRSLIINGTAKEVQTIIDRLISQYGGNTTIKSYLNIIGRQEAILV